jgi:HK97 family phage major capsid protein/HK97 family phage prohead protease
MSRPVPTPSSLPVQRRSFDLVRASLNEEARTIEVSFSSETNVERFFGFEVLGHGPGECDLSRLNDKAPALFNHENDELCGVIESAEIRDGRGYATVRFAKNECGEEVFGLVRDGILTKTSVGYRVKAMTLVEEKDDVPTYRVTSWEPLEVSFVTIPADTSVGVGRADDAGLSPVKVDSGKPFMENTAPAAPAAPVVDVVAERNSAATAERERIAEIRQAGETFGLREFADKAIADGMPVESFRKELISKLPTAAARGSAPMDPKDAPKYSVLRALRCAVSGKFDGLEGETHQELSRGRTAQAKGILIPENFRAITGLNVTTGASGGFTVETMVDGANLIELLRNKMVSVAMGARVLSGLSSNVAIPSHTGGGTAYWLAEGAEVTASTQVIGQVGLTPKTLMGRTALTKQFLAQTTIDAESFVRNDLAAVLAIALDAAALNGAGGAEPTGIIGTSGVGTVAFGAAATFAKMIEFESDVETSNALNGSLGYVVSPATKAKLKAKAKDAAAVAAGFVYENDTINGYKAMSSNQTPSDKVVFGNWSDLILATFGNGFDVTVNPYSRTQYGEVEIFVSHLCDVAVRHAASFSVSTDSGAQ